MMPDVNLRIFSATRALFAAVAIAAVPAAALAEPPPLPAPSVAPAEPAPAVRVLRMPSSLGSQGIQQLATELRIAGESTAVLVRAPGSSELAESVSADSLRKLADAAEPSRLFVMGDTTGVLPRFTRAGVRFEPVSSATALRARLGVGGGQRLDAVDGGTLSGRSLSSLLGAPDEADGGLSPLLLAIAALGLGALALAGRQVRATLRRDPAPYAPREPAESAPTRSSQSRRTPRRNPRVADDARLPASGRALVRSELHPEGYVELDSCLRRARWADARVQPPAPGEWVEVERERGRLIAFSSRRTRRVPHR